MELFAKIAARVPNISLYSGAIAQWFEQRTYSQDLVSVLGSIHSRVRSYEFEATLLSYRCMVPKLPTMVEVGNKFSTELSSVST